MTRPHSRKVLCIIGIISLLAGFISASGIIAAVDAASAARDAKSRVTVLEAELKGGDFLQTTSLLDIQQQLQAIDQDLVRIQSDVPLSPVLSHLPGTSGPMHVLAMASDFVHAGEQGVSAALLIVPNLKGVLSSLDSSATPPAAGASSITLAEVQQASQDVDAASGLLTQALHERAQFSDGDLRTLGLGALVPQIHQLDAASAQMPTDLTYAHSLMSALPTMLGLTKPINYLLFNQDSDELRATGGFQGNYGVLTFDKGKLTGGVHLHDILTLDCKGSGATCPDDPLPSRFFWADLAPNHIVDGHFQLRDANLDPDYPTTAKFEEQLFTNEGGPAVYGMISMTPQLIQELLTLTGPLVVDGTSVKVTATNLHDTIHLSHLLARNAGAQNVKTLDAELGPALMHAVATLPPAQQGQVFKVILHNLGTHDLQIYVNDPGVESALHALHDDGAVQTPQGDSVYVVDVNNGGNYANQDVKEKVSDAVSLDAHGTATHHLTLTYTYPTVDHSFSYLIPPSDYPFYFHYFDFVRVIVPDGAKLLSTDGCSYHATAEAGRSVWGCEMQMNRGDTVTVHFNWTVPNAITAVNGLSQYSLLMQRQAGTDNAAGVTVTPPPGWHPTAPLQAPLVAGANNGFQYTSPGLLQDVQLVLGGHT